MKGTGILLAIVAVFLYYRYAKADPVPPNGNGNGDNGDISPPDTKSFTVTGFTLTKHEINATEPVSFSFDLVNTGLVPSYVEHVVCAMPGADHYGTIRKMVAVGEGIHVTGILYPRNAGVYYPSVGLTHFAGDNNHWIFTSTQEIVVH